LGVHPGLPGKPYKIRRWYSGCGLEAALAKLAIFSWDSPADPMKIHHMPSTALWADTLDLHFFEIQVFIVFGAVIHLATRIFFFICALVHML
jgi:hypothetical protein